MQTRTIIGGIFAILSYLFGALDALLVALIAIIFIEITSSIIKMISKKEICSNLLFDLGAKKIGILSIIALANVIDGILDLSGVLRTLSISYFIANEGISLLENWGDIGLPIPEKIKDVLLKLKSK